VRDIGDLKLRANPGLMILLALVASILRKHIRKNTREGVGCPVAHQRCSLGAGNPLR
jgi:hypothetical protein